MNPVVLDGTIPIPSAHVASHAAEWVPFETAAVEEPKAKQRKHQFNNNKNNNDNKHAGLTEEVPKLSKVDAPAAGSPFHASATAAAASATTTPTTTTATNQQQQQQQAKQQDAAKLCHLGCNLPGTATAMVTDNNNNSNTNNNSNSNNNNNNNNKNSNNYNNGNVLEPSANVAAGAAEQSAGAAVPLTTAAKKRSAADADLGSSRDGCHGSTASGTPCSHAGKVRPQGSMYLYCRKHSAQWVHFETGGVEESGALQRKQPCLGETSKLHGLPGALAKSPSHESATGTPATPANRHSSHTGTPATLRRRKQPATPATQAHTVACEGEATVHRANPATTPGSAVEVDLGSSSDSCHGATASGPPCSKLGKMSPESAKLVYWPRHADQWARFEASKVSELAHDAAGSASHESVQACEAEAAVHHAKPASPLGSAAEADLGSSSDSCHGATASGTPCSHVGKVCPEGAKYMYCRKHVAQWARFEASKVPELAHEVAGSPSHESVQACEAEAAVHRAKPATPLGSAAEADLGSSSDSCHGATASGTPCSHVGKVCPEGAKYMYCRKHVAQWARFEASKVPELAHDVAGSPSHGSVQSCRAEAAVHRAKPATPLGSAAEADLGSSSDSCHGATASGTPCSQMGKVCPEGAKYMYCLRHVAQWARCEASKVPELAHDVAGSPSHESVQSCGAEAAVHRAKPATPLGSAAEADLGISSDSCHGATASGTPCSHVGKVCPEGAKYMYCRKHVAQWARFEASKADLGSSSDSCHGATASGTPCSHVGKVCPEGAKYMYCRKHVAQWARFEASKVPELAHDVAGSPSHEPVQACEAEAAVHHAKPATPLGSAAEADLGSSSDSCHGATASGTPCSHVGKVCPEGAKYMYCRKHVAQWARFEASKVPELAHDVAGSTFHESGQACEAEAAVHHAKPATPLGSAAEADLGSSSDSCHGATASGTPCSQMGKVCPEGAKYMYCRKHVAQWARFEASKVPELAHDVAGSPSHGSVQSCGAEAAVHRAKPATPLGSAAEADLGSSSDSCHGATASGTPCSHIGKVFGKIRPKGAKYMYCRKHAAQWARFEAGGVEEGSEG
ncbi:unnamed protein product [Polarella glacialis]|uniref:Uncharacterized protein n=1 Tax=Polarella glacialis TaxID=89957 RepID=A0A813DKY2_POLGL|nr:unnamed protein product [Polarella glacialis]